MRIAIPATQKIWYLLATIAILAWGTAGLIQLPEQGWGGFVYSTEYLIEGLEPGGPGERAGLRIGDLVKTVAGIPVEELPLYSRWPRSLSPSAGESLQLVVERGREQIIADVVYDPFTLTRLHYGVTLIGVAFLFSGLWALFTVPTSHAVALARIGLVAGVATLGGAGPDLGTWNGVVSHLHQLAIVLWSILLLRFFLAFPRPKRPYRSQVVTAALFSA